MTAQAVGGGIDGQGEKSRKFARGQMEKRESQDVLERGPK